jgi:hypothetical protein
MNNFELDEKAKQYEDTMTPYSLARRIIELEESQNKIKAEAVQMAKNYLLNNGFTYGAPYKLDDLIKELERGEL